MYYFYVKPPDSFSRYARKLDEDVDNFVNDHYASEYIPRHFHDSHQPSQDLYASSRYPKFLRYDANLYNDWVNYDNKMIAINAFNHRNDDAPPGVVQFLDPVYHQEEVGRARQLNSAPSVLEKMIMVGCKV